MTTEYRRALVTWAQGDEAAALDQLMALEKRATPQHTPNEIDQLFRIKLRAVRDLLDDTAEVLVPVMLLHHDAYLRYRDDRAAALSSHSRQMVEELAEVYVARSPNPGAKVTAARILTSLGGHLMAAGMSAGAIQNFNGALDLDPRTGAALLSMAVFAEKLGRLEEAAGFLDRLLAIDPQHAEGRLRRGLVAARLGKTQDAERTLRSIAGATSDPRVTPWIAELAVQELARLLAANRQETNARNLLRESLTRFPTSQRLRIQLAHLEDRAGRRGIAQDLAREASAIAADDQPTPRHRYNAWPQTELETVRASMREALGARRALLLRALGAAPAQAAGGAS